MAGESESVCLTCCVQIQRESESDIEEVYVQLLSGFLSSSDREKPCGPVCSDVMPFYFPFAHISTVYSVGGDSCPVSPPFLISSWERFFTSAEDLNCEMPIPFKASQTCNF